MQDPPTWAASVGAPSWVAPLLLVAAIGAVLGIGFLVLLILSKKYQVRLTRHYLTRFSALAAFLAISFGVSIILVVLSIMGGYVETFRDSLRGQEAHLIVYSRRPYGLIQVKRVEAAIRAVENVRSTARFIESLGMYRSGGFNPCQIRGVDIQSQAEVTDLGKYTLRPEELDRVLKALKESEESEESKETLRRKAQTDSIKNINAILKDPDRQPLTNEEFMRFFELPVRRQLIRERQHPRVAQQFEISTPPQATLVGIQLLLSHDMFLGQIVPIVTLDPETSEPVTFNLLVTGAFKTGAFESDTSILYTNVQLLRNKLNLFDAERNERRYEGVRVAVDDLERLEETHRRLDQKLRAEFPSLAVISWEQLRQNRIKAVEIEKYVIYFLLVLLIAFTAFMVLLMLVLTVIEKTRDIGVLLALGATPGGVVGIFLINGLVITLTGTVAGLAFGYTFCLKINSIHDWVYTVSGISLFPPDVYDMDRIPIAFQFGDALLSVAPALALGFFASLVPAVWASRRDPIKAIHFQ